MSTRGMVNFHYGDRKKVAAKIYKHHDNYPGGTDVALQEFLVAVEAATKDTRFNDPEYLAAKFVVWALDGKLDELGIGVSMLDHGDIEYLWWVDCRNLDPKGRPTISYTEAR